MRVVLDTTYARRAPYSGTGIYITYVCAELRELDGVEVEEVWNRRRRPPAGGGLGSIRNLAADLSWTAVELPRKARRTGAQLIHHSLPARSPLAGLPQVVTVYDLAFERLPHCFDRRYRVFAHKTHRAAALAASAVICISETTANDVSALWGVPRERIVVAHAGPGQQLGAMHPGGDDPPTHFLYVGDEEPRKDLGTLLAAYQAYRERSTNPLELVLAGSASAGLPGVRAEWRPDEARLGELYRGAVALVHPSLYEGFGMTPLEAMMLDTPVVVARSPGAVEVCGDAARYFEPRRPDELARAMEELAADREARAELQSRGRRRAGQFSWSSCARAHLDAYSLALQRR